MHLMYLKGFSVGMIVGALLTMALLAAMSLWSMHQQRKELERREKLRQHIAGLKN